MSDFYKLYETIQKNLKALEIAAGKNKEQQKKMIAQKIKAYRINKNLTQEEFSKKLSVTKMQTIRGSRRKICRTNSLWIV